MICKLDEAFTIQEMKEETDYCKDCKIECPNAKTNEKSKFLSPYMNMRRNDACKFCKNRHL